MPNTASVIVSQLELVVEAAQGAIEEVEGGLPYNIVRTVEPVHNRHNRLCVTFNDGSECFVQVSAPGLWDGHTQRWWEVGWPVPDWPVKKEKWETSDGQEWCHPDLAYQHQKGLTDVPPPPTKLERMEDWISLASHWDDHPDYPIDDWRMEVANNDTRQSYKEWLLSKAEQEDDDADEQ